MAPHVRCQQRQVMYLCIAGQLPFARCRWEQAMVLPVAVTGLVLLLQALVLRYEAYYACHAYCTRSTATGRRGPRTQSCCPRPGPLLRPQQQQYGAVPPAGGSRCLRREHQQRWRGAEVARATAAAGRSGLAGASPSRIPLPVRRSPARRSSARCLTRRSPCCPSPPMSTDAKDGRAEA